MEASDWPGAKYETAETQAYVGLSLLAAREAASRAEVKMVRVIDGLNDTITFDFRPYRLNLLVVDDKVSKAAFF